MSDLNFESQVRNLAVKVYDEQLMDAVERKWYTYWEQYKTPQAIANVKYAQDVVLHRLANIVHKIDPTKWFIAIFLHDKDTVKSSDDLYAISIKKRHYHIYAWRINNNSFRLRKLMTMLGIVFAGKEDYTLWENRGVETFRKAHRPNVLMYGTHETEQAILDGKYQYTLEKCIITNQTLEAVQKIRDKYNRVHHRDKLTDDDWNEAAQEAFELGEKLGDFDLWTANNFTVRQQASSPFRIIKKQYEDGLAKGISNASYLARCSILIWGGQNLGKTYTTAETLKKLGENIYKATKGSGKYDGLTAQTTALTFDDVNVSEIRTVCENTAVKLHRRNSGDRPWLGHFVVATANDEPFEWIAKMAQLPVSATDESNHYLDRSDENTYQAILSRLFICHVEDGRLVCDSVQTRGNNIAKNEHDVLFLRFANTFNKILQNHFVQTGTVKSNLFPDELEAEKMAKEIRSQLGPDFVSGELKQYL